MIGAEAGAGGNDEVVSRADRRDDLFFSNPIDYLPGLNDAGTLEALRNNHLILTTAEHDPCKDANFHLSQLLNEKGIDHKLDFENGVFGHDWPWWREVIRKHIG